VKGEMDMKEFNFLASELDTMKENGTFQELPIHRNAARINCQNEGKRHHSAFIQ
jgi:glycine C-acetyltransferase